MRAALLLIVIGFFLIFPLTQAHPGLSALGGAPTSPSASMVAGEGIVGPAAPIDVAITRGGPELAPPRGEPYWLELVCPQVSILVRNQCPQEVLDGGDSLGNIAWAYDPYGERRAFASLHGRPETSPNNLSRSGQTHSTFISDPLGAEYTDNPYTPPFEVESQGSATFGEDVHAVFDELSTLHVASLYSVDQGGVWAYALAEWKLDGTTNTVSVGSYGELAGLFWNRTEGGRIETHWLNVLPDQHKVVLLWREIRDEPVMINGRMMRAWVHGAITDALDPLSPWEMLPDEAIVGPCETTTNPVVYDDLDAQDSNVILVGCRADKGYDALPNVKQGQYVIHQMDLARGIYRPVGHTPITGGDASLAIETSGRLALASVEVVPPQLPNATAPGGNATMPPTNSTAPSNFTEPQDLELPNATVRARLAVSRDQGRNWGRVYDFGDQVHNASRDVSVARINAMIYRGTTDTIHMVYMERRGPNDEEPGEPTPPMWRKSLYVIDTCATELVDYDLKIKYRPSQLYGPSSAPRSEVGFGDTRDTLFVSGDREFVAWGNYGFAEIMELREHDNRTLEQICGFGVGPQPPNPVPPAPAPAPAVTPQIALSAAGIVSTAASAEALRRMALRKSAVGAGRGRR